MSSLKPKKKITLQRGDAVKVVAGDLKHLMGIVESVDGDKITVKPKHKDLENIDKLVFPVNELQKYFKIGDHVKVLTGKHEGETGMIVRIEDDVAVIYSDTDSTKEVKINK